MDLAVKGWVGDMTETEFRAERDVIEKEIARTRALAEVATSGNAPTGSPMWWPSWHDAKPDQQARLAARILSEVHVKDGKINAIRPRPAWIPYFEELLASRCSGERETRLEPAGATGKDPVIRVAYRLAETA
jgi:hypothetical protein